ncbi:unnamed protein product [Cladocopium goreaui]|uniref:Uncharacterized protein n=1 Tax=Cladocopium goreaui TaxID=2562237 RepID=A0A9P1G835_9DINO|nr:unnamed protein product [Cladocopium goreaui]
MRVANLLPILAFLAQLPRPSEPNDFVEVCAGCGSLSHALRMSGYNGKEFDILYSKNHNLMRTVGFVTILAAVWNTRPGGVLVFAPPCSSWVFLSRLWGTAKALSTLARPLDIRMLKAALARNQSKPLVKKTISKSSGKVTVTGDKRCLQQSANYPLSFGLAIAGLVSPRGAAPSVKPDIQLCPDDPDYDDDGAIDDLIKGRKYASWRKL